jgi:hypothetical protein
MLAFPVALAVAGLFAIVCEVISRLPEARYHARSNWSTKDGLRRTDTLLSPLMWSIVTVAVVAIGGLWLQRGVP